MDTKGYYWFGKDYANTYKGDFKDISDYASDQFDREKVPRMPWRDQACAVIGESARDLARHFIQRWNQCKREKVRAVDSYPFLLPKSYESTEDYEQHHEWFLNDDTFKCTIQMTRSLDLWSGGIVETEHSILDSYCDLIGRAESFIYIENQFFITTTNPEKDTHVQNSIGMALVKRIKRAFK